MGAVRRLTAVNNACVLVTEVPGLEVKYIQKTLNRKH